MFILSWNLPQIKWGVLFTETGITIGKQLSKRFFEVQPNDGYTDTQVTQSADVVHQIK